MKKLFKRIFMMRGVWLYSIVTVLYVIWTLSILYILDKMGVDYSQNVVAKITDKDVFFKAINVSSSQIIAEVFLPLLEELFFRWLPLFSVTTLFYLVILFLKKKKRNTKTINNIGIACVVIVVVLFSACFGYGHGNYYNLLIQGVLGLILSMIYLRVYYRRRWAGKRVLFQFLPYLASSLYHILTNQMWYVVDYFYR